MKHEITSTASFLVDECVENKDCIDTTVVNIPCVHCIGHIKLIHCVTMNIFKMFYCA